MTQNKENNEKYNRIKAILFKEFLLNHDINHIF